MAEIIRDFWGVIAALIGAVAWLVRLESRGITNAAEIKRLWGQRKDDMDAAREGREQVQAMLVELREDVKALLREARR